MTEPKLRCMCGHPEHKGVVHRVNAPCYSKPVGTPPIAEQVKHERK